MTKFHHRILFIRIQITHIIQKDLAYGLLQRVSIPKFHAVSVSTIFDGSGVAKIYEFLNIFYKVTHSVKKVHSQKVRPENQERLETKRRKHVGVQDADFEAAENQQVVKVLLVLHNSVVVVPPVTELVGDNRENLQLS
jgi:hypothetical protein